RFRGREMAHPEAGKVTMEKFAEVCEEYATVEKAAKLEGRQMLMFLAAKTAKPQKKQKPQPKASPKAEKE
ncbi:MAG TPA: translation initiation factor IF-3 C-terminal domain-containing protein, partial [Clostridiales bacterium]|nr:translation initiation factor IF-3 C-terminal domain-containing protein [Clostridiales bacterium]